MSMKYEVTEQDALKLQAHLPATINVYEASNGKHYISDAIVANVQADCGNLMDLACIKEFDKTWDEYKSDKVKMNLDVRKQREEDGRELVNRLYAYFTEQGQVATSIDAHLHFMDMIIPVEILLKRGVFESAMRRYYKTLAPLNALPQPVEDWIVGEIEILIKKWYVQGTGMPDVDSFIGLIKTAETI